MKINNNCLGLYAFPNTPFLLTQVAMKIKGNENKLVKLFSITKE